MINKVQFELLLEIGFSALVSAGFKTACNLHQKYLQAKIVGGQKVVDPRS